MLRRRTLVVCLATVLAACAAGPSPTTGRSFNASLITREQIQERQFSTAYDAVKELRGTWLNQHGPQSFRYPATIQVYLDGVKMGDVSTLQTIAAPSIQYIRFYNAQQATDKWGIDHNAGAIYVSTKIGPQGGGVVPPA